MATIVEIPEEGPLVREPDGFTGAQRKFRITGVPGKVLAWDILNTKVQLYAPYRNYRGDTPSINLVCLRQEVDVMSYEGSDGTYIGTCIYGRRPGQVADDGTELEIDGDPVFTSESGLRQVNVDIDRDGNRITNTAGVPFDRPFSKLVPNEFLVIEFIRNESFVDALARSRGVVGKLNNQGWLGAGAENVLCHELKPKPVDKIPVTDTAEARLYKFSGRFEFRDDFVIVDETGFAQPGGGSEARNVSGFTQARVSVGIQQRIPDPDNPGQFLLANIKIPDATDPSKRVVATTPQLLDEAGRQIVGDTTDRAGIVVEADVQPVADFASILGIG